MEHSPAHEHPESLPGGLPDWFDPRRDAMLTPGRLRGLVHPIRVRLLHLLQADGPATASQLGRKLGQSSGVTSYHLRMLADLGFIVEDSERGNGRDRYWRSRYRTSSFTFRAPDDPGTPETVEMAVQYIRMGVEQSFARTLAYLDSMPADPEETPKLPWQFSEFMLALTHDEARALGREVADLLQRYRHETDRPLRPGAVRAEFQFQIFPAAEPEPAEPEPQPAEPQPAEQTDRI
jgi:DNA-binding transcriptional ArsR family regulator